MSVTRAIAKPVFAAADRLMKRPSGPRILIYHQVGAGLGRQMEVTLDSFRRQLDWLAAHRQVVDLDTAIDSWDSPDSDELVVLTFDDGYRDLYTTAFPLMRERAMPFTLYLTTRPIEHQEPLDGRGLTQPLAWSHIREMSHTGLLTVGAHTHTHPDFRNIGVETIEWELGESSHLIERRLDVWPEHFAYPYGFWSPVAHEIVIRKYRTAVLGGSPRGRPAFDPHLINRYPVQLSDGFVFFKERLAGGLRLEEQLRRSLKGYAGP